MNTHLKFRTYEPGNHHVTGIPFKAHKIDGFSPEMLERHFEDIYGGAVRRLNELEEDIAARRGNVDALRAEALVAANGVVLHELHFGSIAEDGGEPLSDAALQQAIEAGFGSVDEWQREFAAMATSLTDGWMVLAWSDRFGQLTNIRLTETAALTGADPILVIDMGEHARSADFGADRNAYVKAFIKTIHWGRVAGRFQQAVGTAETDGAAGDETQISVAALKHHLDKGDDVLVLDVRHDDDRERYRSRIRGTEWRDSFDVAGWAETLPKDKPVVVYCMYGFWVSQKAAEELREHGVDARSLSGGVTSWRAMGYPSSGNVY